MMLYFNAVIRTNVANTFDTCNTKIINLIRASSLLNYAQHAILYF